MKIKELLQEQTTFFTDKDEIIQWCNLHITDFVKNTPNYRINNGVIDIDGDVRIIGKYPDEDDRDMHRVTQLTSIPVKFGKVYDFICVRTNIRNTDFLPSHCEMLSFGENYNLRRIDNLPVCADRIVLSYTPLTEFPAIPGDNYSFVNLSYTNITSLIGVHEKFAGNSKNRRVLCMSFNKIKEGGLGLILVDRLEWIEERDDTLSEPFEIIKKYLGKPESLYECQAELLDNGYEAYAKL